MPNICIQTQKSLNWSGSRGVTRISKDLLHLRNFQIFFTLAYARGK